MKEETIANIKASVVALLLSGLITWGIMSAYDKYVESLRENVTEVLELPW